MAEQDTIAEILNDDLCKELEPEANEVLFGQKTLPNRPLTNKEMSKRNKIILKLVDQKLKFQLIGLMEKKQRNETSKNASESIPIINHDSQSLDTSAVSTNYQSVQNWPSYSQYHPYVQYPEQDWQPNFPTEWQSSIYAQQSETIFESSWDNSMPHQSYYNFQHNMQHCHQDLSSKQSYKRGIQRNTNLIHPAISVTSIKADQNATKRSVGDQTKLVQERSYEKISTSSSSNLIHCNQIRQGQKVKSFQNNSINTLISRSNQHPTKNQLLSTERLPPSSNVIPLLRKTNFKTKRAKGKDREFFDDEPIDNSDDWLHQPADLIGEQTAHCTQPSNLIEVQKLQYGADKLTESTLTCPQPLLRSRISDSQKPLTKRKRKRARYPYLSKEYLKQSKKADTIVKIGDINGNKQCSGNIPIEWNEINRLVNSILRNEFNQLEPLSSYEQKLRLKFFIQMSLNPNSMRSEIVVQQYITKSKLEEIISNCKMILLQLKRTTPQIQSHFAELRNNLIRDLKELNVEPTLEPTCTNEDSNLTLVRTKIRDIIEPLLHLDDSTKFDEKNRDELISQLIQNPGTLKDNEVAKEKITNMIDVMRDIKRILDEFIVVRPPKTFNMQMHRFFDVPFVVNVHDRSGKMTYQKANTLQKALSVYIHNLKVSATSTWQRQLKIINWKFSDGTLRMVCANYKTFTWIEKMISKNFDGKWIGAQLCVIISPVKNPISKSELKPVVLKFKDQQFLHFNYLMDQLKKDNPCLFTRRWELQKPTCNDLIDSECLYVGVDIESLDALERMNRVCVLLQSTVCFEICYDDNEKNFLPNHFLMKEKCE